MDKRKSFDNLYQNHHHHHHQKLETRKSLEIQIIKEKEEKYINELLDNEKRIKSPSKNDLKGLITSNTITLNEFKQNSPSTNKAFKDFSLIQFQNESFRNYMEDRFSILTSFPNEQCKALFAIFDGHGGSSVSQFLCQNFISTFLKISQKFEVKNYEKIFQKCFITLDEDIRKIPGSNQMGSTATVILITKETDQILGSQKIIYCANIGDTNCELFGKSDCKRISYEHRCSDSMEEKRIKKINGSIINGRVGGVIAVTRSFGDFEMKELGVISEPNINKVSVNFNEKYFLIMATDGVWDFISDEDTFFSTMNNNDSMDVCKDIVNKAKENGSTDNMTCMVINL